MLTPVVGPEMDIVAVRTLYVTSGFRADDYSDIGSGRSYQHGFTWKPHELLEVRGTRGTSLRAPSLYDLYYPRIVQTSQVVDPRRHESVPVTFTLGGNPDLKPTRGESWSIGFTADNGGRWRFSLDHWRMRMHDRVWLVPYIGLLANEDQAGDRIVRADPTASDILAGLPGPITLIDISRANVGEVHARGLQAEYGSLRRVVRQLLSREPEQTSIIVSCSTRGGVLRCDRPGQCTSD